MQTIKRITKHHTNVFIMRLIVFVMIIVLLCPTAIGKVRAQSVDDILNEIAGIENEIQSMGRTSSHLTTAIVQQDKVVAENKAKILTLKQQLTEQQTKMQSRLRSLYMFGVSGYLEILFTSKNMGDFFSKIAQIGTIIEKDQSAFKAILETKNSIEQKQTENEKILNDLLNQQNDLETNMAQVEALLNERNALLSDQRVAEAYAQQVTEKTILQSSSSTSKEESHKEEVGSPSEDTPESESTSSPSGGYATQTINPNDFDMICAIVRHEGGASYEGALGVISCVMNRCDVGWGGNDPLSVLTAPSQFESYFGGYYEQFLGADIPETRQAVRDCVEGGIRSHEFLSFRGYEIEGALEICGNYYFYPKSEY